MKKTIVAAMVAAMLSFGPALYAGGEKCQSGKCKKEAAEVTDKGKTAEDTKTESAEKTEKADEKKEEKKAS